MYPFGYIHGQSPERMTVNHDVTGSSPVGGAKVEGSSKATPFYFGIHFKQNWARKAEKGNAPA